MALGYKGMLAGLFPQIGVGLGVLLLFGWNPPLLITALLATALIRGLIHGESLTEKSKLQVAKALSDKVISDAHDLAEKAGEEVYNQTQPLVTAINVGLDNQLRTLRDEFAAVIKVKQAGETDVQDRLRSLNAVHSGFQELDSDLTGLVLALADPGKH